MSTRSLGPSEEAQSADSSDLKSAHPSTLFSGRQRWTFLTLLFLAYAFNVMDRAVISVLLEPIRHEFHLTDGALGLLSGLAFAALYAAAGLPFARWADLGNRRTIISVALAAWSAMTVLCGMAQSVWHLVLARMGVGMAEAGYVAPSQSLIADYFPVQQRPLALGIWAAAGNIGFLLGIGAGGYIAASYGWRAAFIWVGLPGVLLAIFIRFMLAEPRLTQGFPDRLANPENLVRSVSLLQQKRSYRYALLALCCYSLFARGTSTFLPSFMLRTYGVSLEQVSLLWGLTICAATTIGAVAGGRIACRLAARDPRWLAWLPALVCLVGAPVYWTSLLAGSFSTFLLINFAGELLLAASNPVAFAAVHSFCGNRRRATAFALVFLATTIIGVGLGPVITGFLSDLLKATYGEQSLQYSLVLVVLFLLPAALSFYVLGRVMPADMED